MSEDTQTELESEQQLKIIYLEEVIKKVMEFNSLGKSLKIHEICATALENMEEMK